MSLKEYLSTIEENRQYELAVSLLKTGLPIWTEYTNKFKKLDYVDTVVGMYHKVEKDIIERTIKIANDEISGLKSGKLNQLKHEYLEPVVALQDLDWELPESVLLIFYSAKNLIESMSGDKKAWNDETTLYISINQSIDAITRENLMKVEEVKKLLQEFKDN